MSDLDYRFERWAKKKSPYQWLIIIMIVLLVGMFTTITAGRLYYKQGQADMCYKLDLIPMLKNKEIHCSTPPNEFNWETKENIYKLNITIEE